MAFLEIRDLSRRFPGVAALQAVDLDAEQGEVHALIGANGAGKSTLMNILAGVLPPTGGEIRLGGAPFAPASPRAAQAEGIGAVYQELSLIPERTVAQNVFLGREPANRLGVVDRRRLLADTEALLARHGLPLEPQALVADLTVAQQQLVEIARALSLDARVLILDEPSAVLSLHEQQRLFEIIAQLKAAGLCILYVSHRLDEIFVVADRVTVLRDGRKIATLATAETTQAALVRMMIGHDVAERRAAPADRAPPAPLLKVVRRSDRAGCRFALGAGEILGIAGFVGAGRTHLARTLMGLEAADGLELTLDGRRLSVTSPRAAIAHGILYVTEDRKREGLFGNLSVLVNTTAAALPRFSTGGILRRRAERTGGRAILKSLRLVAHALDVPIGELSGGNQQKVVIARALLRAPRVLLCDEPTRGIDVGAKEEIYALLTRLAGEGVGIVVISSDLEELLGLTQRILVMRDRAIVAEFRSAEARADRILLAATGATAGAVSGTPP